MSRPLSAKAKVAEQAAGVRYGCHVEVDLDAGDGPDACVKDHGDELGCIYASHHRSREGCTYWQPVTAKGVDQP